MRYLRRLHAILTAVLCILLANTAVSSASEIDHQRFMQEFAQFVQDKLLEKSEIRTKLDAFIMENRKELADGFGIHPELIPKVYELAGTEKLECLSGRYFITFQKDLTNEEREAFYHTKRVMDRWVYILAAEEAARLNVTHPSPPMNFRSREDIPVLMEEDMRATVKPYLDTRPGKEGGGGAGFNDIKCD